jgi:hypothetical protein
MAEELVRGIKSTSKSGSPHNESNAALVRGWFGGTAAATLVLRSRPVYRDHIIGSGRRVGHCGVYRYPTFEIEKPEAVNWHATPRDERRSSARPILSVFDGLRSCSRFFEHLLQQVETNYLEASRLVGKASLLERE